MKKLLLLSFMILFFLLVKGQTTNDILNVLVGNNTVTQEQADSLRAEFAIKQQTSLPDKKFKIELELRPRTEYREGYKQLPNDTTSAAFFTSQRTRLSFSFVNEYKLAALLTLQDSRVWGQYESKNSTASVQIFEAWAEPYITENFSVRIGRQRLVYDNQRLFAENNWTLTGAVHDALNLRYNNSKVNADLAFAFNQTGEQTFGTYYKPPFSHYKFLAVNNIVYKLDKNWTITLLNTSDGFQSTANHKKTNYRFTDGGRLEYLNGSFYLTLSGYYQWGKNEKGVDLSAWYLQPELRYTAHNKFVARLGAELMSGTDTQSGGSKDHAFNALYGTAHSFNGSLDLFTRFPADLGNAGLINPYLFLIQPLGTKWELRADFHTFSLMENYYQNSKAIDKYLGFENDWLLSYKPDAYIKIDAGFSYALVTESMEILKKAAVGSHEHNPGFAFISVTFKPQLFGASFK